MKSLIFRANGIALAFISFIAILISIVQPASALLEPKRLIDPHTVAEAPVSTSQVFEWAVTPKSAIPDLAGKGMIGSRIEVGSGFLDYQLKNASLVFEYNNTHHTGAFTNADFQNVDPAATSGGTGTLSTITFPLPITTGTMYKVSFDISDATWFTAKLQVGAGSPVTIGQFKKDAAVAGASDYKSKPIYTNIQAYDQAVTTCSGIANGVEADIVISIGGVAQTLTAEPSQFTSCGSVLDKTSYDSASKTATLKQLAYNGAGVVLPHSLVLGSSPIFATTSLTSYDDSVTVRYQDLFVPTNNSAAPVYFQKTSSGNNDSTAVPVASATFDFSVTDADLTAQQVTFDTKSDTFVALAHNLNKVSKGGTFTLYVPFHTDDKAVGVCPGVSTLGEVSKSCANLYYLADGETKNGATASIATIKGVKYWKVDGLTGTGGFSAATAGSNVTAPNTGFGLILNNPLYISMIVSLCGAAIFVIARKDDVSRFYKKIRHSLFIGTMIGASLLLSAGIVSEYTRPTHVNAYRMPDTSSLLAYCREGNTIHAHMRKPKSSADNKIFTLNVKENNVNNTQTVYVEGKTSIYLDATFDSASNVSEVGVGTANGLGQGMGGAGPLSYVPDCL